MTFHRNLRGKDLHAPSNELVENNSGSTLAKLTVVSLDGLGTAYPQVIKCDPINMLPFGVVQEDIANTKSGYVTVLGFMFELDTSAWTVGTALYCDPFGNLSETPLGTVIAFVVKQDIEYGVLYVSPKASANLDPSAWQISGNVDNPIGAFLGTADNKPINFKTNNIQRAILDVNGRLGLGTDAPESILEIKSHTSSEASGLQVDTFYVETNNNSFNNAIVIAIDDPSVVKIEFHAFARQADGQNRGAFERSALFYRESSNTQIQGNWQSSFTQKSDTNIDVTYTLSATSVTFKVRSASSDLTKWSGHVKIQKIF